jgi:RNA polymerase sigma-70 factor (ECF subfamily)
MAVLDVAELFREHAGFVERVLRRSGVADRDLSDATQEVFVVVHRRSSEFEGRAHPRSWLYRIAWNVASETRRRAFRRRELLEVTAEPPAEGASAQERLEAQEALAALHRAIDVLAADKREALICHELDGEPMRELAARLGVPLKTAFSRLYAARRALEQELRKQGFACLPFWAPWFSRVLRSPERALSSSYAQSSFALAAVALLGLLGPPAIAPEATITGPARSLPIAAAVPALHRPPAELASATLGSGLAAHSRKPRRALSRSAAPAVPAAAEALVPEQVVVIRSGALDLGLGPFGESSLADPPWVAPERHPRAKLGRHQ